MPASPDQSVAFRNGNVIETENDRDLKNVLVIANLDPSVVWDEKVPNTELEKFQKIIEKKYNLQFDSFWELHKWSVQNYVTFWEEMWHYHGIIASKSYDEVFVKTGNGFLDCEWFRGAEFNFAENVLRIRDSRAALRYLDESLNEETVTFKEMFEEVKLYAAAFRANGLKKGDRVACMMSNRKEPIFAMLAATSIGAIWGGVPPYFGARNASCTMCRMEPKFLFAVDYHQDNGVSYHVLNHLSAIVKDCPSIEKVILKAVRKETYEKDLSNILNCIFLEDFLQDGRRPDGTVPDILFEQLPASHPICINFTSGTSGQPKGLVHAAWSLISLLRDYTMHFSMGNGDVLMSNNPVGWSVWEYVLSSLSLGVTIVLLCGNPEAKYGDDNYWDLVEKYRAKGLLLITTAVENMGKRHTVPRPGTKLDCLKMVGIIGNPAKNEYFEYLLTEVKKEILVISIYGSTEVYGAFSGCNINMPVYSGEIQAPGLGMDLQCFDSQGRPVIGQRGELVVCTPAPNFPTGLWKDVNAEKINACYLAKYPGVWNQSDECWINPKTNGFVVIGRIDDILKQNGCRFCAGDIYSAIHGLVELEDYICVGQQKYDGGNRAVLFVKMREGYRFTPEVLEKIQRTIDEEIMDDCIPEFITDVPDIPYNINGKRLESVVRRIIATNEIPDVMNARNPHCLKYFLNIPQILSYNQK